MNDPRPPSPAADQESGEDLAASVEPEKLVWLDSKALSFQDPGSRRPIRMTVAGDRSYRSVIALRAFPRHQPDAFVQLFQANADETRGAMVGIVRDPDALAPKDKAILEEALQRSYLVPKVLAILELEESRYMARWTVETDRGVHTFDMHRPHRNVIASGSGRVILIDVEENRYEIPDAEDLDDASRRRLDRVL